MFSILSYTSKDNVDISLIGNVLYILNKVDWHGLVMFYKDRFGFGLLTFKCAV